MSPWVIFESWRNAERDSLGTFFEELDYRICALPPSASPLTEGAGEAAIAGLANYQLIALPIQDLETAFRFYE